MPNPMVPNIALLCGALRRRDDREAIADALTQVAALPCSPEGLQLRASVAEGGGLEAVKDVLLKTHADIRLQCKAANALASLCMSEEVARGFLVAPNSSAVVDRLGDMLRSRSQWAQADAAGCLGWLVGTLAGGTALHELIPLVTRLMVRHTTKDDEVFISEERQREQQAVWGRSRSSNSREGPGDRGGGGGDKKDQARERMDNIRVYSLIFLLKASQADPSTMPAMVEAGAISGLLMHLATAADGTSSSEQQQQQQQQQQQRTPKKQEADSARAGGVFEQRHHGTDGSAADEGGDQTPPSLLLAARLLYAISLDPGGSRSSLLEAKCLPPLIRLRRQLHAEAAAEATTTAEASATTAAVQPALECAKRPVGPSSGSAAFTRKGGTEEVEEEAFMGKQQAQHSGGDVATGDNCSSEPDVEGIEVIVSLIVDQLVGRPNGR
ncbi:unnamed protein product [Ectocarpus sp. 4 AP-2014]